MNARLTTHRERLPATPQSFALGLLLALPVGAPLAQGLEEVVVTAQKRQETVQDVANPITVFTAEEVHALGIRDPRDLAMQTPGLLTKNGPNGLATVGLYIRGVGINDFTGTVDSSVGVYVDEVFKSTPDTLNFAVFDVERIEVLKGPQGILYGRNSTGGAINFLSARPTEEVEGYVRAGYSRFDAATLEGALGGPLADNLQGRVSFSGQLKDGGSGFSDNRFSGNTLGDDDWGAVRAQLQWQATEDFDARLIYSYGKQEAEVQLLQHVGAVDPVAGPGTICAPVIAGRRDEANCTDLVGYQDLDGDRFDGEADVEPFLDVEAHNVTAHLNWRLPRFTVTSITNYEDFQKQQAQDLDVTRFAVGNNDTVRSDVESFTQELRLTSDDSWPFAWMLGAFYYDNKINWFQTIDLSAVAIPTSNGADQDTNSWAVFAHVGIPFAERFEIEGGVRYTHEERDWVGGSYIGTFTDLDAAEASVPLLALSALPVPVGGTLGGDLPGGPQDFDNNLEENNVDFKATLKFHYSDELMFYAAASEAFRSGGVSSAVIFSQGALAPFGPESLRSYEAGFKWTFLDGRAQFDANGYFYDWEDYQATFVRGTEVSARLQNAGDVEIYGVELALRWLVTDALVFDAGFSWLENEIVKSDVGVLSLSGGPTTSIEGNEIANAPSVTFNARARYEFAQVSGFLPQLQFEVAYVDDHFLEPNNRKVLSEDGYVLVNGRLGFKQDNGPWEGALWVKNLTDETYLTAAQDIILALGFAERSVGLPRTFGIEVGYRF